VYYAPPVVYSPPTVVVGGYYGGGHYDNHYHGGYDNHYHGGYYGGSRAVNVHYRDDHRADWHGGSHRDHDGQRRY